jgi:molybdenum cofactor biosynthesis protein B
MTSSYNISREFKSINIAILTVSDTRTKITDKSGDFLSNAVVDAGHNVIHKRIVKDELVEIKNVLEAWSMSSDIDVIISTGGTGLTKRDVSVEAHSQVYEKEITAFPSMFASISMEKIGTSALQSRACAGVRNGTYLFALPGSPSACRDAWENLLRPQFDYRHLPCNFVEIMPRLVKDSIDKS